MSNTPRALPFPASEYVPRAERTYDPTRCIVFCKTKELYGGFSNMAAGFPLMLDGTSIRTSEALYQTFRFPSHPEVQKAILNERSPMSAKMVAKANVHKTRPDWEAVRVEAMWYSLRIKLAQNWTTFGDLLRSTEEKDIVELSRRDGFWGAVKQSDGTLKGCNVLGILLGALRWTASDAKGPGPVGEPTSLLPDALFLGRPIRGMDL